MRLAGAMFAAFALLSALDRANPKRFGNAAFWGLMALSLLGGDLIGDLGNGLLVLGLVGLAGFGFIGRSHPPTTNEEEREDWSAARQQAVPARADHPRDRVAGNAASTITRRSAASAGSSRSARPTCSSASACCSRWPPSSPGCGRPAIAPLQEGRRLIDAIGWAAVLPQMLAALGALFAAAGVGDVVGELTAAVIPRGSVFADGAACSRSAWRCSR